MAYGIALHVWGDYACFTRPEMKVERVSYDVMTPSAARGIVSAIYWKPQIEWVIDRIHVLKPIRFESVRRNELGSKLSTSTVSGAMKRKSTAGLSTFIEEDRQQRAATVLRDVAYIIEAHFRLVGAESADNSAAKHISMFNRRAQKGLCFQQPCLGVREFPAHFAWLDPQQSAQFPKHELGTAADKDLGWMLHDITFGQEQTPHFFRAEMKGGVIDVPPLHAEEVMS